MENEPPRYFLNDGKVLVTGGIFYKGTPQNPVIAEIYDPTAGTWTDTGAIASERLCHTATLLPDGRVLIVGGVAEGGSIAPAETYDPGSRTFSGVPALAAPRYAGGAALLSNGNVLVAGGDTGSNPPKIRPSFLPLLREYRQPTSHSSICNVQFTGWDLGYDGSAAWSRE